MRDKQICFTDEDLKRLKDLCEEGGTIGTYLVARFINRLEAAEKVINSMHFFLHYPLEDCEGCNLIQHWFREAGK